MRKYYLRLPLQVDAEAITYVKQAQLPVPKGRRRLRTETELTTMAIVKPIPLTLQVDRNYFQTTTLKNITLTDFTMISSDTMAVWELQKELNMYMLQRLTLGNNESQHVFLNIQDYFNVTYQSNLHRKI